MTHISNSSAPSTPSRSYAPARASSASLPWFDAAQSGRDIARSMCRKSAAISCRFPGHKMCGPTGIGVLYGRKEVLDDTPPYQGGGEMILNVEFQHSTWKHAPHKFEAGTPDISGAIGLRAAMDLPRWHRAAPHRPARPGTWRLCLRKLSRLKGIRLFGPHIGRAGLISFLLPDVHAHDVVTVADQRGVALRGGHHCKPAADAQNSASSPPPAPAFYFYNTTAEIDRFVEMLGEIQKFFGS